MKASGSFKSRYPCQASNTAVPEEAVRAVSSLAALTTLRIRRCCELSEVSGLSSCAVATTSLDLNTCEGVST